MEKIKTTSISIGGISVWSELYKISKDEGFESLSRVYVIAIDKNKEVPLIYNSKRNIWGFPGGHIERGESVAESANRECIEEIKKSIKDCEQKFLMINKLDGDKKEKQIICFARIGEDNEEYIEENESIKKVVCVPTEEIIFKIGNRNFWEPVIKEFKEWI